MNTHLLTQASGTVFSLKPSTEWLSLPGCQEEASNFSLDFNCQTGVIFSYLNTFVIFVKHTILYQTIDKILPFALSLTKASQDN